MSSAAFRDPCRTPRALEQQVQALEAEHNARQVTIDCQFTARQARGKLKHLYPDVARQLN